MSDQDRNDRAETEKRRDDSGLIDDMADAPGQSGAFGRNLSRDIGTRDELEQAVGDGGITRVSDSYQPEQANLPRFNQGNSKLHP